VIGNWTIEDIRTEVADAYAEYVSSREARVRAYFRNRPGLASPHPLLARDPTAALPAGHANLADRIGPAQRHRWWLSGKSSQMLALGVLGVNETADPELRALGNLTGLDFGAGPKTQFELELDPRALGEKPRTTTLDYVATSQRAVLCVEAKWTEEGMGLCSCGDANRQEGSCSSRVLSRRAYRQAAARLELAEPPSGGRCAMGTAYQAVRLFAATTVLARDNGNAHSVAALFYDEENPFFDGHNAWPGWVEILSAVSPQAFVTCSWQALVGALPLDEATHDWAIAKFGLA
jgi:hypothetical protein